jgi:hypothetical protein
MQSSRSGSARNGRGAARLKALRKTGFSPISIDASEVSMSTSSPTHSRSTAGRKVTNFPSSGRVTAIRANSRNPRNRPTALRGVAAIRDKMGHLEGGRLSPAPSASLHGLHQGETQRLLGQLFFGRKLRAGTGRAKVDEAQTFADAGRSNAHCSRHSPRIVYRFQSRCRLPITNLAMAEPDYCQIATIRSAGMQVERLCYSIFN